MILFCQFLEKEDKEMEGGIVSVRPWVLQMNVAWFQKFCWSPINLVPMGPSMFFNSTFSTSLYFNICFMLVSCFQDVIVITVKAINGKMTSVCSSSGTGSFKCVTKSLKDKTSVIDVVWWQNSFHCYKLAFNIWNTYIASHQFCFWLVESVSILDVFLRVTYCLLKPGE